MLTPRKLANLKQTFGGKGVVDFHRNHAFPPGAHCAVCTNRPAVRAIVMAPFDEVKKRRMLPEGQMSSLAIMSLLVQIKHPGTGTVEPFVRLSTTYACTHHVTELERAMARAPSWCIIEINKGPEAEKVIVSG